MSLRVSIFLAVVGLSSAPASAGDEWFCTQESSKLIDSAVHSCGIGTGSDEDQARAKAFDNAKAEFQRLCFASDKCRNREVTVDPKRTTCEKTALQFTCVRLVIFKLGESREVAGAIGNSRPRWTSHAPMDTAKLLFFVGRSSKVSSEADGIRMASKDAREQLLRQEFGTTVKVDTVQRETLHDVSMDSQLSEISDLILLKGFKQSEVYAENTDGEMLVWVLFSVPRSEIKDEKSRIVALQKQKQSFSNTPAVVPSKEFDNGGKPKLKKGMKKSQVIALFGAPEKVDGDNFRYRDNEFCEKSWAGSFHSCWVWFESGRVRSWSEFVPGYTTDLDDEPETHRAPAKVNKKSKVAKSPDGSIPVKDFVPLHEIKTEQLPEFIPDDEVTLSP